MDDLATLVKWSSRIEGLLIKHYHAEGNNLSELINSCEERIPRETHDRLRCIEQAYLYALQQPECVLQDSQVFVAVCKQCEQDLQPRSTKVIWRLVLFLIFAATAGAVWFYAINWTYITAYQQ